MSVDQIQSKTPIAEAYNEELVRFGPDLATKFKCLATGARLSFAGHSDTKDGKVMYFGGENESLSDTSFSPFFQGYTPQEFVDLLIRFGLPKNIGTIELWSCGIGDTSADGSFCYAREVAKLLAQHGYLPTVLATSGMNLQTQAKEPDPLTGQSLLVFHNDTSTWSMCAIPTSVLTNERYQRCGESIRADAKSLAPIGMEFMQLRSLQQSEEANLELSFSKATDKLAALRKSFKQAFPYEFLDDDAHEGKYEELKNIIEDIEYALEKNNDSHLAEYSAKLESEIKQLNSEEDRAITTKASALLESRKAEIKELLKLSALIKIAGTPRVYEKDFPLSYFIGERIETLTKEFKTASDDIAYASAVKNQFYKTFAEFEDIRKYLSSNPDCNFSMSKVVAGHSPRMFASGGVGSSDDTVTIKNPLYKQRRPSH